MQVSLLTKKGYLTISLSHGREGRLLLRRHEGIRDWFGLLKAWVQESRARQEQQPDLQAGLTVESWLLSRQVHKSFLN